MVPTQDKVFGRDTLQGAEIVLIPTANLTGETLDLFEWEMRVAAYHSDIYVAMCNRVGRDGDVTFCGQSMVAGPNGHLIAKADGNEQLLVVDIRSTLPNSGKRNRKFLGLRRPEMYD